MTSPPVCRAKTRIQASDDKGKGKERVTDAAEPVPTDNAATDPSDTATSATETPGVSTNTVEDDIVSPLEQECAKARAVLNANIGACYVKLVSALTLEPDMDLIHYQEEWTEVVSACSAGNRRRYCTVSPQLTQSHSDRRRPNIRESNSAPRTG